MTRLVALSDAVSLTDVTAVSLAGTVILARTWRWVDPEKTVPRLHAAVPFPLPQPKLKTAFWVAGVAATLMTTSETLPFCAQAATCQVAATPRTTLSWVRCTLTHRLGCGVVAAGARNAVSVAAEEDGVAGVSVELAGEDGGSVATVADDAGVVAGALDAGMVGDGDGGVLVPVPVPVLVLVPDDEVLVGVVVGGTCTCWHCQTTGELVTVPPTPPGLPTVAARLCGAAATLAAKPAVAVRRVPPVMRPIATGRTRAKHM